MKLLIVLAIVSVLAFMPPICHASTIQYIGTGKPAKTIEIAFSRNKGASWTKKTIKPGQVVSVPPDATHLYIDNNPRNPSQNYKIKDGFVFN